MWIAIRRAVEAHTFACARIISLATAIGAFSLKGLAFQPTGDPCSTKAVNVAAQGLNFRSPPVSICGMIIPIPFESDPCAAQWGPVGTPPVWQRVELNPSPAFSACWYNLDDLYFNNCGLQGDPDTGIQFGTTAGYPLNINLLASPSIGDFPPPSATIRGSSVALEPFGEGNAATAWAGVERPTHAGSIDLITGAPLAQVCDLELPFGGATFRLIRTRSHSQRMERESYTCAGGKVIDDWWDWAGNGWMISESPLLLIDSAVPDIVGDGPRTSYLVLDAHHSIPFQRMDDDGRYEAPARFKAKMTHNGGEWNPATATWAPLPTKYDVSLYDGALTYSFLVIRQDVPDNVWELHSGVQCSGVEVGEEGRNLCRTSMHARPILPQQVPGVGSPTSLHSNPGQGVPYYGLCYMIEDRNGHVVDITLGGQRQHNIDNPQSPGPPTSNNPNPTDCVECNQDCPGKGQIRTIRLRTRGSNGTLGEPAWTLVYRYRTAPRALWDEEEAASLCTENQGQIDWLAQLQNRFDYFGTRTLHSITAFRGETQELTDFLLNQPDAFFSVSSEKRQYEGNMLPTTGALDLVPGEPFSPSLESAWVHRVDYRYAFQSDDDPQAIGLQEGMLTKRPKLIKISSKSRQEANGALITTSPPALREWVFEYENDLLPIPDYWLKNAFQKERIGLTPCR